jgi:hypothetical protein
MLHLRLLQARRADGLSLPVVVHRDQRQRRFLIQLVDLGQSLQELFVTMRIIVSRPCLGVSPPLFEVVNANNKHRLS